MAVFIPANYGAAGVKAQVWTKGTSGGQLMAALRAALAQGVQRNALLRHGLSEADAAQIQSVRAPLLVTNPDAAASRRAVAIGSAASLVMVYLLLMAVVMNGSMMLQGVIEERSNKLLEAILACIRPTTLMNGKLIGLGASGLLLIAVWVAIILFLGHSLHGPIADFLKPVIAGLGEPWRVAALLFYFLAGYLAVSLIFLAIGSVSNSMQDAQGFLMPLIWALMIPIMLMLTSSVRDPDGLFPRVMSWIPIYTPFAMLARLGHGVAPWEVAGTGALLVLFLLAEFVLVGRLFESNLLASGRPGWGGLKKLMAGK